ncbi:MAG: NADH-quinone oxidoreductase subunit C [Gammaproteobacteria bacterium RIFCSPLOWO2_02_FULL_61_13]|nr:MAG: NADH-quinone oxidoreductase subunit C [Gammaproteobacteria bacterium RIFCSPLOWO2_02_FULL_61_13]
MSQSLEAFHERLRQRFGDRLSATNVAVNQVTIEVPVQQLIEVCTALRDEPEFRFEQLLDLCGMDYSGYGQAEWETDDTTSTGFSRGVSAGAYRESRVMSARFASVCQLLSVTHNRRLRVRCFAPDEPPRIPSVVDIWASANWYEREAFDLFGILFEGHPDLRRLLTDYGFIGHPFRKDFPLEGNVEVRYDPDKKRVIYQPVTIKNRVLVPRVIRHDNRYEASEK